VIHPPNNRVPEFVASDPKLWDAGNRLVEVHSILFGFLGCTFFRVFGFAFQGFNLLSIVGLSPLHETA
jgi:hypothetical protein